MGDDEDYEDDSHKRINDRILVGGEGLAVRVKREGGFPQTCFLTIKYNEQRGVGGEEW